MSRLSRQSVFDVCRGDPICRFKQGNVDHERGKTGQELFGCSMLGEDKLKGPVSIVGNSTQTFLFYFLRVEKWRWISGVLFSNAGLWDYNWKNEHVNIFASEQQLSLIPSRPFPLFNQSAETFFFSSFFLPTPESLLADAHTSRRCMETSSCQSSRLTARGGVQSHQLHHGLRGGSRIKAGRERWHNKRDEWDAAGISCLYPIRGNSCQSPDDIQTLWNLNY